MQRLGVILAALVAALTLGCKESPTEPKGPNSWHVRMVAKNLSSGLVVAGAQVTIHANSGDADGGVTDLDGKTRVVVIYQDDEPVRLSVSVPAFVSGAGAIYRKFDAPVTVAPVWDPREQAYVYMGNIYLDPLNGMPGEER